MNQIQNIYIKPASFPEPTYTRKVKVPVMAGMPFNGNGSNEIKKVGYDLIQFTYAKCDDMLYWQERIKRVLY